MTLEFFDMIADVDITALPKWDEKTFIDKSRPVSKAIVNEYNEIRCRRYGWAGSVVAEFLHEYYEISRDSLRRMLTVSVGDDLVILLLKRVLMFDNANYLRIDGLPISVQGKEGHEQLVLDAIARNKLSPKIQVVDAERKLIESWGYTNREGGNDTYNFVYHLPSRWDYINRSKWRSKNGINKVKPLIIQDCVDEKSYESMIKLTEMWSEWKDEHHGLRAKKLAKGIKEHAKKNNPVVKYYMINHVTTRYTPNIPIGFAVYILTTNNMAHLVVNKPLAHTNFEPNDEYEESIKRYSGRLLYYHTMEELQKLGVEHVFFGGVFSQKTLAEHKKILTDDQIGSHIYRLYND
tara:strand:- start:7348 stop:8394 length:1047 start_codon:yes stop_codon:yes gene_type:complete